MIIVVILTVCLGRQLRIADSLLSHNSTDTEHIHLCMVHYELSLLTSYVLLLSDI